MIKKKDGFGMFATLFIIVFVGLIVLYGTKIGFAYFDKNLIEKYTKIVLLNNKNNESMTTKGIKDEILKKVDVDQIEVAQEDITVTKNGNDFNVIIDFTQTIEINKNIKVVVNFIIDQSTP